jgi:hypothetical protein
MAMKCGGDGSEVEREQTIERSDGHLSPECRTNPDEPTTGGRLIW